MPFVGVRGEENWEDQGGRWWERAAWTLSPTHFTQFLACEQALQGATAAGREKEGEHATASLEFEYLLWKSWCKMLIGGDDISNDVITLSRCFSMFVYIHTLFCFVLIGRNLTAQSTGSHRKIGGGIQIPET